VWDESGEEIGYVFTPEVDDTIEVVVTAESGDLDLFVLGDVCLAENCLGFGNDSVTVNVEAGRTYYIIVDGYSGQSGPFTLTVDCASTCVPQCDGKECGFDGCFGECGECEEGDVCLDGGCETPTCVGACGDMSVFGCWCDEACFVFGDCCKDVCDVCPEYAAFDECVDLSNCGDGFCNVDIYESCSNCPDDCACGCGEECIGGDCAYVACDGKECGGDGCGMSCGTCSNGESCLDGLCESNFSEVCDIETTDVCVGNTVKECTNDPWHPGMFVVDCAKHGTTCEYIDGVWGYDCVGCGNLGPEPVCDGDIRMHCDVEADIQMWYYCKWYGANHSCQDGDCVCAPECSGMECGDDGCGGSCGECDVGMKCDDGQCLHVVGSACDSDLACSGGGDMPFCMEEEQYGWLGGYCSTVCESYGAGPCPQGSSCHLDLTGGTGFTLCHSNCLDDSDCRLGYKCDAALAVCVPCGPDEVVDCDGKCAPLDWVGDGICDEGQFGANLNCEVHSWDLGDCCPDDLGNEPNDACATATAVQGGEVVVLAEYEGMSICPGGDEDWYSLLLPSGTLLVDLTFEHMEGDLDMFLYDESSCVAFIESSASVDDNEWMEHSVTEGGLYFLRVMAFEQAEGNTYDLWFGVL